MKIGEMFHVGSIMEWEDKSTDIPVLGGDDCLIIGKSLNRQKIILHFKRTDDGSEGNVFVKLKDEFGDNYVVLKKLFASSKVLNLSLNQFKNFAVEDL